MAIPIPAITPFQGNTLILVVFTSWIVYFVAICVYRLTFHPYARHPGPFIAKLSNAYALYHAYRGDVHIDIYACHERYGEFVRYGPDRLLVNTPTALKDIYSAGKTIRKSLAYIPLGTSTRSLNVHHTIDRTQHARKRRIVSQGFSDASLRATEPYILEHIRIFTSTLLPPAETSWSGPHNLAPLAAYLTLDIISHLAFGQTLHLLTSPRNHFVLETISANAKRAALAFNYPSLFTTCPSWLSLEAYLAPTLLSLRSQFKQLAKDAAEARMAQTEESDRAEGRRDIMSFLLAAKDPETGEGMPPEELWAEARLLLSAGTETTSTAICATLFYLSRSPVCLAKLQRELDAVFADVEEIVPGPKLSGCAYLRACIDEAMRLAPPAPGALWREVQHPGAVVGGKAVPGGLDVGVGTYAVHHREDLFPHAFEYQPERWIVEPGGVTEEQVRRAMGGFAPFSVGWAACLAKGLAYREMEVCVARLMWEGEMRVAGPLGEGYGTGGRKRKGEYQLWDQFTAGNDGPLLQFRRRKRGEAESEVRNSAIKPNH